MGQDGTQNKSLLGVKFVNNPDFGAPTSERGRGGKGRHVFKNKVQTGKPEGDLAD